MSTATKPTKKPVQSVDEQAIDEPLAVTPPCIPPLTRPVDVEPEQPTAFPAFDSFANVSRAQEALAAVRAEYDRVGTDDEVVCRALTTSPEDYDAPPVRPQDRRDAHLVGGHIVQDTGARGALIPRFRQDPYQRGRYLAARLCKLQSMLCDMAIL
jgi:hypothetical protein